MALSPLWVKVSTQLPRHPKTIKAASNLEITIAELIGHLCMLWIYCAEFRPNGFLANADELARAMAWDGEPEKLAAALVNIPCFHGFLDVAEGSNSGFFVHDWNTFNNGASSSGEKRREEKRRKEESASAEIKYLSHEDMQTTRREMPEEVKKKFAELFRAKKINVD